MEMIIMYLKDGKKRLDGIKKNSHEYRAWNFGQQIIGVDEVGRGCLAGPVIAAAVALKIGKISPLLKDSKLLSAIQREKAFGWIVQNGSYGIGIINHTTIDMVNIWQATLKAMKQAVLNLGAQLTDRPESIIVDAMPLTMSNTAYHETPVHHFPFAESKSNSIAAASIVAKITRDRLMGQMDRYFNHYKFAQNKGYGTKCHRNALKDYGHCIVHRTSFHVKELEYA